MAEFNLEYGINTKPAEPDGRLAVEPLLGLAVELLQVGDSGDPG